MHELENDAYDFRDNFEAMTLAIRMGGVGIVAALQDHGLNEETYKPYVEDLAGDKVHPVQFDELYARVTYNCSRLNQVPWYWYTIPQDSEKPVQLVCLPLNENERSTVMRDWDQEEFAHQLAFHWAKWGFEFEDVFFPPNRVATYMLESGEVLLLDPEGKEVGRRARRHGGASR